MPDAHYLGRGFPDHPGGPLGHDGDTSIAEHSDVSRNAGFCPCESFQGPAQHSAESTQGTCPLRCLRRAPLRCPFASKSVTLQLCSPARCPERTTAGTLEIFPIPQSFKVTDSKQGFDHTFHLGGHDELVFLFLFVCFKRKNEKLHLLPTLAHHSCWGSTGVRDRINREDTCFSLKPSACLRSRALLPHPVQVVSEHTGPE